MEDKYIPKHKSQQLFVHGYNCSLLELPYPPHFSQSNNQTQSSHSIFSFSNLSNAPSKASQLLIVPTIGSVTVHPVGFKVVIWEKRGQNFPVVRHSCAFGPYIVCEFSWWKMKKGVVLHFQLKRIIIEPQDDFLFLPTTNLLVAFVTNFLADQSVMSCVGGGLTFHFEHETLGRFVARNLNLNGIINICTDDR